MTDANPDNLTGADVFDTSLSPTDPAELVAWLRERPASTVLLDRRGDAWQVRSTSRGDVRLRCTTGESYFVHDDPSLPELTDWAPLRVIWTSGGPR